MLSCVTCGTCYTWDAYVDVFKRENGRYVCKLRTCSIHVFMKRENWRYVCKKVLLRAVEMLSTEVNRLFCAEPR